MLAKIAAGAGGLFLAVAALGNAPTVQHPQYVVACLCLVALLYMAYRAGKSAGSDAAGGAHAEASAKSKAAALAAGGRSSSAVQVNIGGQAGAVDPALVAAVAAELTASGAVTTSVHAAAAESSVPTSSPAVTWPELAPAPGVSLDHLPLD